MHSDTSYNNKEGSYNIEICSEPRNISDQLNAIFRLISYKSLFLYDIVPCINIFGNNSQIISQLVEQKLSDIVIINYYDESSGYVRGIITTLFLQTLTPHIQNPFIRFARNIIDNPYSSSLTILEKGKKYIFNTNISHLMLCSEKDIKNYYNSTIKEFIIFYHSINYSIYQFDFVYDIFLESRDFPSWFIKLQNRNTIESIRDLLLLSNIQKSNFEYIKCLIDNGVNFNLVASAKSLTPLRVAVTVGDKKITKLLIENGANLEHLSKDGLSYLMIAAYFSYNHLIDLLLEQKVEINTRDYKGNTAIMYAVEKQNYQGIKLLLNHDADISILNNNQ